MPSPIEALYETALAAVPATGEISYADLVASLQTSGNANAVPMIVELKKRGAVTSRLEFVNGQIIHTYRRSGGNS